jgi:hypothetical protein
MIRSELNPANCPPHTVDGSIESFIEARPSIVYVTYICALSVAQLFHDAIPLTVGMSLAPNPER